jgi:hypothetical protein
MSPPRLLPCQTKNLNVRSPTASCNEHLMEREAACHRFRRRFGFFLRGLPGRFSAADEDQHEHKGNRAFEIRAHDEIVTPVCKSEQLCSGPVFPQAFN